MNELWREQKRLGMEDAFKWSIIDRWPLHQGFIEAVTDRVEEALVEQFDEAARSKVRRGTRARVTSDRFSCPSPKNIVRSPSSSPRTPCR